MIDARFAALYVKQPFGILSSKDENIYELTLDGLYVDVYDMSNILSTQTDAEGLTCERASAR